MLYGRRRVDHIRLVRRCRSHELLVLVHGNVTQHVRRHAHTDSRRRRWSRGRATHFGSWRCGEGRTRSCDDRRRSTWGPDVEGIETDPVRRNTRRKLDSDARTTIIRNHPLPRTNAANRARIIATVLYYLFFFIILTAPPLAAVARVPWAWRRRH